MFDRVVLGTVNIVNGSKGLILLLEPVFTVEVTHLNDNVVGTFGLYSLYPVGVSKV